MLTKLVGLKGLALATFTYCHGLGKGAEIPPGGLYQAPRTILKL